MTSDEIIRSVALIDFGQDRPTPERLLELWPELAGLRVRLTPDPSRLGRYEISVPGNGVSGS